MIRKLHRILSNFRGQPSGDISPGEIVTRSLSFGPLSVQLTAGSKDPIARLLTEDFAVADKSTTPADVHIRINQTAADADDQGPRYVAGNNVFFERKFTVKEPRFSYSVENAFAPGTMIIDLRYKPNEIRPRSGASEFEREQLHRKLKDLITSYNCLWYLFAVALMKRDCGFLHAGVVEKDGKARVFAGVGGSGKTSLTTRHLEFPETAFLAEDFGVFGADGKAYFSPKTATIYASDVKYGQSDLVRYVQQTMAPEDRADWVKVEKSGKNPRRKISPRILFGEKCKGHPATIAQAFFINRQSAAEASVEAMSIDEFSRRCLAASIRELKRLTELLQQAAAVVEGGHYPTPQDVEAKLFEIYKRAFASAEVYLVRAPIGCSPDDLVAVLPGGKL